MAKPGPLVLRAPGGLVDPATIDGMPEFLRNADQLTELMILAGPGGEDIGILRQQYGYRPEAMIEAEAIRLEWESGYVDLSVAVLVDTAIWLQADFAGAGRRGSSAMRRRGQRRLGAGGRVLAAG
jgi:hypothetical protein